MRNIKLLRRTLSELATATGANFFVTIDEEGSKETCMTVKQAVDEITAVETCSVALIKVIDGTAKKAKNLGYLHFIMDEGAIILNDNSISLSDAMDATGLADAWYNI